VRHTQTHTHTYREYTRMTHTYTHTKRTLQVMQLEAESESTQVLVSGDNLESSFAKLESGTGGCKLSWQVGCWKPLCLLWAFIFVVGQISRLDKQPQGSHFRLRLHGINVTSKTTLNTMHCSLSLLKCRAGSVPFGMVCSFEQKTCWPRLTHQLVDMPCVSNHLVLAHGMREGRITVLFVLRRAAGSRGTPDLVACACSWWWASSTEEECPEEQHPSRRPSSRSEPTRRPAPQGCPWFGAWRSAQEGTRVNTVRITFTWKLAEEESSLRKREKESEMWRLNLLFWECEGWDYCWWGGCGA